MTEYKFGGEKKMSLILGRVPLLGDCDRNSFEYKESGVDYVILWCFINIQFELWRQEVK